MGRLERRSDGWEEELEVGGTGKGLRKRAREKEVGRCNGRVVMRCHQGEELRMEGRGRREEEEGREG